MQAKRRVLLTGVTGYIGGRLAPRLLEEGFSVRVLVRSPRKLEERTWATHPDVEIFEADLGDANTFATHMQGCEAAYYLVHSMLAAGSGYADRDKELASTFAQAAGDSGIPRIIYLGGLGETGKDLSEHLQSRRNVETALASTGVPLTVLRAAMIIGSGSASFEILRYLVERLPIMVCPKWVQTLCQPIAVQNVIGYLTGVLDVPASAGQTFDIGGSEVMSYRQIMDVMADELKLRRRWVIPVPVLTPRLSSYWIHLVTPISHKLAKPLAEGLRNPVVCRDQRITQLVPQQLLDVRSSIRVALKQMAAREVETCWSMAGPIPGDPDWAGGTVFEDLREVSIDATPSAVFRAVCSIGGGHGWYSARWLWRLRGWIDNLVGGPGLRRGRRHAETIAYGEALDFWRVTGIRRDRWLALRAEMKLPGDAMLEFRIKPREGGGCVLRQEARFAPRGLYGLLYWYAVLPFHHFVFSGMLNGIRREAERSRVAAPGTQAKSAEYPQRLY